MESCTKFQLCYRFCFHCVFSNSKRMVDYRISYKSKTIFQKRCFIPTMINCNITISFCLCQKQLEHDFQLWYTSSFVFVLASGGKYCFYDQQLGSIWFDMPMPKSVQSRMESTFLILHLIYILYLRNPKNIIFWFQFTLYAAKSRHITSLQLPLKSIKISRNGSESNGFGILFQARVA